MFNSRTLHAIAFTFLLGEALYYLIAAFHLGSFLYLSTHQIIYISQLFCLTVVLQSSSMLGDIGHKPVLKLMIVHIVLTLFFLLLEKESQTFGMNEDNFYNLLSLSVEAIFLSSLFLIKHMKLNVYFKIFVFLYSTGFLITIFGTLGSLASHYGIDVQGIYEIITFLTVFTALFTQMVMLYKAFGIYKEKLKSTYNFFFVSGSIERYVYFHMKN